MKSEFFIEALLIVIIVLSFGSVWPVFTDTTIDIESSSESFNTVVEVTDLETGEVWFFFKREAILIRMELFGPAYRLDVKDVDGYRRTLTHESNCKTRELTLPQYTKAKGK